MRLLAGLVGLLLLVSGCADSNSTSGEGGSAMRDAFMSCDNRTAEALDLVDDGKSLIVTATDDADFEVVACVMVALGAPSSLVAQIDSTTALMGRQETSANGYTYVWSYHPDNGLNMTITED